VPWSRTGVNSERWDLPVELYRQAIAEAAVYVGRLQRGMPAPPLGG
jgi:hypothetical protein